MNIWESLSQAEDNSGKHIPAVVFKRNRTKTYITLELEEFLNIIGEINGLQREKEDREEKE